MKKKDLASLAMIAISAGFLIAGCQQKPAANSNPNAPSAAQAAPADVSAFRNSLSSDSQKQFDALDAQHKSMAMQKAKEGTEPNQAVQAQYNDQMKQDQDNK